MQSSSARRTHRQTHTHTNTVCVYWQRILRAAGNVPDAQPSILFAILCAGSLFFPSYRRSMPKLYPSRSLYVLYSARLQFLRRIRSAHDGYDDDDEDDVGDDCDMMTIPTATVFVMILATNTTTLSPVVRWSELSESYVRLTRATKFVSASFCSWIDCNLLLVYMMFEFQPGAGTPPASTHAVRINFIGHPGPSHV